MADLLFVTDGSSLLGLMVCQLFPLIAALWMSCLFQSLFVSFPMPYFLRMGSHCRMRMPHWAPPASSAPRMHSEAWQFAPSEKFQRARVYLTEASCPAISKFWAPNALRE